MTRHITFGPRQLRYWHSPVLPSHRRSTGLLMCSAGTIADTPPRQLGRLKDPRAIPLLRAASRAEDLSLSEGAYDGLAEIGGAAVLNDLATHVATAIPSERSAATKRLIRSADASSIPGLLQLSAQ